MYTRYTLLYEYQNLIGQNDSAYKSTWSGKTTFVFCLCVIAGTVYTLYELFPLTFKFKNSLKLETPPLNWLQKDSSACILPKLNPFDSTIQKYISPADKYNCTKKYRSLFYTDLESNLILNSSLQNTDYVGCCYKKLSRGNGDNDYIFSKECTTIQNNITKIPDTMDFIAVYCKKKNKTADILVDLFGLIHLKRKVKDKLKYTSSSAVNSSKAKNDSVNVVILGLDAISHMNFIRTMPRTYAFLTGNLSAVSMNGFTKVGDGTFPNIFPALIGISEQQTRNCKKDGYFDACPLIWKDFSNQGHRTIYVEDAPDVGIFNRYDSGFKKQPTDYYFRPVLRAQDELMSNHDTTNPDHFCSGPRLSFEIILDCIKKAAYTFAGKERYFQFLWTSIISYGKLNNPRIGDDLLFNTLQWLYAHNYLNNTVLILMSNHGIRYGPIRDTYQGSLEERMPFFFSVFPEWFQNKYSLAMKNYRDNSNRLTTPFDVHETLTDLAYLENIGAKKIKERSERLNTKLSRGISWFLPQPEHRNCFQAAIPEHFCVCHQMKHVVVRNNTEVLQIGEAVVNYINEKISPSPQCTPLKLTKVTRAQKAKSANNVTQGKIKEEIIHHDSYIIGLLTTPGNASFEATVLRSNPNSNWIVAEFVSRTNLYGNQSYCVQDPEMKKYCFCK